MSDDALSRLRWRCRRGTRELDLILQRFLERGYPALDAGGRAEFEELLDCEDDRLQAWLVNGDHPGDERLAAIVGTIRHAADL